MNINYISFKLIHLQWFPINYIYMYHKNSCKICCVMLSSINFSHFSLLKNYSIMQTHFSVFLNPGPGFPTWCCGLSLCSWSEDYRWLFVSEDYRQLFVSEDYRWLFVSEDYRRLFISEDYRWLFILLILVE
jgi:hypothetical protein